jgi:hypothetical protein
MKRDPLHGLGSAAFSASSFLVNASGKPGSSSPGATISFPNSFLVTASGNPGSSEPSADRSPLLTLPPSVSSGGMASVSGTVGLDEAGGEFCSSADVLAEEHAPLVILAQTSKQATPRGLSWNWKQRQANQQHLPKTGE